MMDALRSMTRAGVLVDDSEDLLFMLLRLLLAGAQPVHPSLELNQYYIPLQLNQYIPLWSSTSTSLSGAKPNDFSFRPETLSLKPLNL